jgi:hypothetical protein
LERLDQTLNEPLVDVSWSRDVELREDVTIAHEASSYTNSTFAAAGGLSGPGAGGAGGKAWISKDANQITGIALDISKTVTPMTLWGMEVKYTLPELESAMKLGRPIDAQKYEGLQLKWNMDVDEQVYVGDSGLSQTGLINSIAAVVPANVANGASGSPLWVNKTPDELLGDVNEVLTTTWANSGWAVIPDQLRLPPAAYGYIVANKVGVDGAGGSILKFLLENNLANQNGRKLNIQPLKWLIGSGAGGTLGTTNGHDRMIAYTKDRKRVRFPMTLLQRTPLEYRSLFQITTYYCRLGGIEIPYPETMSYRDGVS